MKDAIYKRAIKLEYNYFLRHIELVLLAGSKLLEK